jgi:Na+-transporting NADH:ubiquinone oxidoreductase subunit NqrF
MLFNVDSSYIKEFYDNEYKYKSKDFNPNEYLDLRYFDPLFFSFKHNLLLSKMSPTFMSSDDNIMIFIVKNNISHIMRSHLFDCLKSDIRMLDISTPYEDEYVLYTKCDIETIKQILQDFIYNFIFLNDDDKDELSHLVKIYKNTSFKNN